jgi:ABC-type sugar transport system substrate-binding protein
MSEVLFLIPALISRPFFSGLACECQASIRKRLGEVVRPIWQFVSREPDEFDTDTLVETLWRELRQSDRIQLLVVAPTASKEFASAVAEIAKEKNLPVLALSLPFHHRSCFRKLKIDVPPVVITDSAFGTQALGRAASEAIKRSRPNHNRPLVYLFPGQTHRIDSAHRLRNFCKGMSDSGMHPRVVFANECNWQRHVAKAQMTRLIANTNEIIDVVFAANDEMALGVRDAIREAVRLTDCHVVQRCLVFGFDAISEARSLILDNDTHFMGTVEQDLEKMAEQLAKLVERALAKQSIGPADNPPIRPRPILQNLVPEKTGGPTVYAKWRFLRSGNGYYIAGFGESGHLSNLRGLALLAHLIRAPGESVTMVELVGGNDSRERRSYQPTMDREAMKEVYTRLNELRTQREEAKKRSDLATESSIDSEIDDLEKQLENAISNLNSQSAKLRPKIHGRLKSVYKAMRGATPPMIRLADHFEASITSEGLTFRYEPNPPVPVWAQDNG